MLVGDARKRRLTLSGWPIWDLPPRLLWPLLCVELTATLVVALALSGHPTASPEQLLATAVIGGMAIVHTEIARPIEKRRWRMLRGELHVELTSVWVFAAAIVIPVGYAALLAGLIHFYVWLRSARARAALHRAVFTSATLVLSCVAAATIMPLVQSSTAASLGAPVAVGLATIAGMLMFLTVNSALVAGAIAASTSGASAGDLLGGWDDNVVEIAALILGAAVAAVHADNPWLVALLLLPVLSVQRGALVRQLQEAATVDAKTGLLNAGAWTNAVNAELGGARTGQVQLQAVLVLDLDHFKEVNDRHGHVAGDRVLASVGAALRREVRDRDLVGRFGGEEFVVFLNGDDGGGLNALQAVADRLRKRVERLGVEVSTADGPLTVRGLTVSVGVAVSDGTCADLQTLLETADSAMYAAKDDGRNKVRMGGSRTGGGAAQSSASHQADQPGRRASDFIDPGPID